MKPIATALPRESVIGRYAIHDEIAAGGMASVFLGRMRGERGFSRTVAIKRLHPQLARDPDFVSMFLDEARLAARIQHRNVVAPLDVVTVDDRELLLVMEYIHGEALSRLIGSCRRSSTRIPAAIAVGVVTGVLHGLHAAHQATSETGHPLDIVHRDVSPQNIMVGVDGVARVLDFGIAKASLRADVVPRTLTGSRTPHDGAAAGDPPAPHAITQAGVAKGKLSYMSPEQIRCEPLDRRSDVFAAAVVLWEMLALMRLFQGEDKAQVEARITKATIRPPSEIHPEVTRALDAVLARALDRDRDRRYATAREFADALEQALPPASPGRVGQWLSETAGDGLAERARILARMESSSAEEDSFTPSNTGERALGPDGEVVAVRVRGLNRAEAGMTGMSQEEWLQKRGVPPAPWELPPQVLEARRRQQTRVRLAAVVGLVVMVAVATAVWLKGPDQVRAQRSNWGPSEGPQTPPRSGSVGQSPTPPTRSTPMTPVPVEPAAGPATAPANERAAERATASDEPTRDRRPTAARRTNRSRPAVTRTADARHGRRRTGDARAPASRTPAAAKASNDVCDPPYTIDERGIRRIKRQCLP
jgi:eukaryotic-like serine/threonine-protein kinase